MYLGPDKHMFQGVAHPPTTVPKYEWCDDLLRPQKIVTTCTSSFDPKHLNLLQNATKYNMYFWFRFLAKLLWASITQSPLLQGFHGCISHEAIGKAQLETRSFFEFNQVETSEFWRDSMGCFVLPCLRQEGSAWARHVQECWFIETVTVWRF